MRPQAIVSHLINVLCKPGRNGHISFFHAPVTFSFHSSTSMAPLTQTIRQAGSTCIDALDQTMHVAGVARANTTLCPRATAGDTSSDQAISPAGIVAIIAGLLAVFGLLAWLIYRMMVVEPRKKKERLRVKRKEKRREEEIRRHAPGAGGAEVVADPLYR